MKVLFVVRNLRVLSSRSSLVRLQSRISLKILCVFHFVISLWTQQNFAFGFLTLSFQYVNHLLSTSFTPGTVLGTRGAKINNKMINQDLTSGPFQPTPQGHWGPHAPAWRDGPARGGVAGSSHEPSSGLGRATAGDTTKACEGEGRAMHTHSPCCRAGSVHEAKIQQGSGLRGDRGVLSGRLCLNPLPWKQSGPRAEDEGRALR